MESLPWILGIWLILAPFALGYSYVQAAFWNDFLLGWVILYFSYRVGLPFPTWFKKTAPPGTKPT